MKEYLAVTVEDTRPQIIYAINTSDDETITPVLNNWFQTIYFQYQEAGWELHSVIYAIREGITVILKKDN